MLYHVADPAEWEAALAAGVSTVSTRGRTLDEEGFIHLSTAEQWPGVVEMFYRGAGDLVLLHVDESRLTAPLQWDEVPGMAHPFPHLYGPLNVDAVVATEALRAPD